MEEKSCKQILINDNKTRRQGYLNLENIRVEDKFLHLFISLLLFLLVLELTIVLTLLIGNPLLVAAVFVVVVMCISNQKKMCNPNNKCLW